MNRPFYSCALSYLAMKASEARGDLVLLQTSLRFYHGNVSGNSAFAITFTINSNYTCSNN